ncbi:jg10332 [Pararge aegeria aegeria]|uniref:Jg10332 protein n=1 Tax=Pararge aegeria aegeria TaxID=348720 RepID=A0A8S4RKE1_9NEOP|nr:jg10332 [Pararge aegeria aegeria]
MVDSRGLRLFFKFYDKSAIDYNVTCRTRDAYDPHRARNEIKSNGHNINKYHYKLKKPMFIQTEVFIKRNAYEYPNATHESVLPEFKPITDAQMKKINEIIKELSANKRNSTNGKRKGRVLDIVQVAETPEIEPTKIYDNDKNDVDSNCSQGGTCEFFFYCWMVGGLLDGSCGSLLKGCCHRLAKAGLLGVQDSNSIEYTPNEGISYGPVINDESKC